MMMNDLVEVLYVYRCTACGHRAELHLPDDSHDGEATVCAACGASVRIEWDGGVTFENSSKRELIR
jgi:predicted nucleic acid-binding Zn ribbon protein